MAQLLEDDLQLFASAPGKVFGTTAQTVGVGGLSAYFYWWVTHFPIGVTITGPIMIHNAPDVLSAANYVIITATPSLGATTYDLLRTPAPIFPSFTGNFAVAIGLTSPTFNDQGGALMPFNPTGLPFGAPVSAHINLNNRDYSQPTLVVAPFQLAVTQLRFPDGTTQATAAPTAGTVIQSPGTAIVGNVPTWANATGTLLSGTGLPTSTTALAGALVLAGATGQIDASYTPQIYSWQQSVVGNGNSISGVANINITGSFQASGGITGVSLQTGTGTTAWGFQNSLAGVPVPQNFSMSDRGVNISCFQVDRPGRNFIIGTGINAGVDIINLKPARLQVYMPSAAPNTSIPMIYAFNAVANSLLTVESQVSNSTITILTDDTSGNSNCSLSLNTPIRNWTVQNSAGLLNFVDFTAGLSRMVIDTSGHVGISVSPTHLLQLGSDDAAKPTTNTWTIVSDIRTKKNVKTLEGGLDVIRALEPIEAEYNGKCDTPEGSRVVSFDPRALAKVLPGCVSTTRGKLDAKDSEETDILAVNTHEILHHLILAVQQLERMISAGQSDPSAKPRHRTLEGKRN